MVCPACAKLISFRPDVLIATANQNYWFLLFFLKWLGISIIPSFHCVLWPKFVPVRRSWRVLLHLNRLLILRHVKAALVASKDIAEQLRSLVGNTNIEIEEHLPTYSMSQFAPIASPRTIVRPPFRIFFAGRIEANKGIYDLVEIARRLNAGRPRLFVFDFCGDGGELSALRQLVAKSNLQDIVKCHGYLDSERLSAVLASSHAVIVPTTSRFEEGIQYGLCRVVSCRSPGHHLAGLPSPLSMYARQLSRCRLIILRNIARPFLNFTMIKNFTNKNRERALNCKGSFTIQKTVGLKN